MSEMKKAARMVRLNETLFERCGADRALYLTCRALMEGRLAPFSVGTPNNGWLLHIDGRRAAAYVRAYEKQQAGISTEMRKNIPMESLELA